MQFRFFQVNGEFQKLIAAVAIIYCLFQVPFALEVLSGLFYDKGWKASLLEWCVTANIFNSAVNFVVYLLTSPSFRRATRRYFRAWAVMLAEMG